MRNRSVCLGAVALLVAVVAAAGEPDAAERSRRRTPVVEVFESTRDAVVNISSTEIVEVRDPFDRLRRLLPELLDVERRYRITSGLRLDTAAEPTVDFIEPGSPAASAGIEPGDVLHGIDGVAVGEAVDFYIALIGRNPGDRLRLELSRGGRAYRTSLRLEGRPQPGAPRLIRQRLGVGLRPLPADLAHNLGLPRGGGFVVVDVDPGGPASAVGIRSRDVLVALGRYYPTTLEEFGELLEYLDPGQEVSVTYLRVKPPTIFRYQDRLVVR